MKAEEAIEAARVRYGLDVTRRRIPAAGSRRYHLYARYVPQDGAA